MDAVAVAAWGTREPEAELSEQHPFQRRAKNGQPVQQQRIVQGRREGGQVGRRISSIHQPRIEIEGVPRGHADPAPIHREGQDLRVGIPQLNLPHESARLAIKPQDARWFLLYHIQETSGVELQKSEIIIRDRGREGSVHPPGRP